MPPDGNDCRPPALGLAGLLGRRDLLRVGSLSIAASAVPAMFFDSAAAAEQKKPAADQGKAKSVIFLWMAGGVTHIDSFDPKPEAPVEYRGILDVIDTSLPGVRFCETLPHLAKMAHELCVVRSFSHDSDDHLLSQVYTLSGRKVNMTQLFSEPNIGSIIWHLQGPRNGLPGYIAVPGITRPGPPPYNFFVGGWMGSQYAPYCLGGLPEEPDFTVGEKLFDPPAQVTEDLKPKSLALSGEVPLARLEGRTNLRLSLDRALRSLEQSDLMRGADGQFHNAVRLLTTPNVRRAFEVDDEPDKVREVYGRTKIGGRCLQARRLVEAGARFVMVDYGYDPDYGNIWDNHNAPVQKHPPIQQMCRRGYHLAGMDKAFAALIGDLRDRGLLETTLVVFLTEFGRTPKINPAGGRDHWGKCGSIFFTGAGIKTGQVIGESDRTASRPLTHPYGPADLAATIYYSLGINPEGFVYDIQNRPRPILDHGEVMKEALR
ncbi:MAG TPA: DUF1501 domain-containing protein [Pirellulaceae bacterium]|nr:DUF1501 domain-containing protein [Pirellulaceae bacterium]